MTDIILVAVLVAFFALSVLFVRACERIIGPDLEADARRRRRRRAPGRGMTGAESVIGLALSALVAAYLVYALLFPEKL